ncbi:hypothetical protein BDZ90DRAFT_225968 [Jaminaea rosea]|uniref:Uncharacterized protein n=1 Tax=Jaminaea rosea TaxID=1569628 RepID=A0A316V0K5_9BASI|nr:hypothetical protein BDZ90DRAFT_225968 [Jaminaea rosea]PWN29703.1 hypothetical protein BDZ90DRAFT_225968 [Jaminaea rosea]
MVTRPYEPALGAESYSSERVLSESVKILADVIQAWIKTSPMRESLRRKESKREKGARKIGESEQDAIWLNEGLALATLDSTTRQEAMQRSLLEHGEPTTPPSRSPITSPRQSISVPATHRTQDSIASTISQRSIANTSASTPESITRPQTPRIEISAPDFFGSSASTSAPPEVLQAAIERVGQQQDAVEAEINQWMSKATLSEFTRPRPPSTPGSPTVGRAGAAASSPTSSPMSSPSMSPMSSPTPASASSAPPSRTASPVYFKTGSARKTVTFSEPAALPSVMARPSPSYLPAFAPHVQLSPCASEEDLFSEDTVSGPRGKVPSSPAKSVAPLSMPPPIIAPTPVSSRGQQGLNNAAPMARTTSNTSTKSLPSSSPTLSPTSPRTSHSHSRSRNSSKLSQEVSPSELAGVLDTGAASSSSGRSSKSTSPVSSFSDLRQALRSSFKPKGSKAKVSPV